MLKKLVGHSPTNKYNKITKNNSEKDQIERHNPFSDAWDIQPDIPNPFIWHHDNIIRLKQNCKKWISCVGTKIVTKGEYKRWCIKILPRNGESNLFTTTTTKIMIGILDIESLSDRERGNPITNPFWIKPYFGYAYGAEKGKKYHNSSIGMTYSSKYKIGDVITIELNRLSNRYIMHNDLRFFTNDKVNGQAFTVDHERNYVLAVALCSQKYDIQIL